ncbi:MAG: hypothetical protein A2X64_11015 [Ignavibacteria bacterium GWF2_33_9]|nr:MAG: hypothetical protein A2X64_11015 [Ignavibacteria bacterium GWF2_33_9]
MKVISNIVQVVIFSFFPEENQYKILLMKRAPNEDVYPNLWQICTGTSEEGETALQTALRELREEAGITDYLNLWSVPKVPSYYSIRQDAVCFSPVFAIEIENNTDIILSHEHSDFGWYTFDEAEKNTFVPSYHESIDFVKRYIIDNEMNHIFMIKGKK